MRDETGDNEPLDTMVLELQIEIGVRKAAGTPMLLGHDVARMGSEFGAEVPAPGPIFKRFSRPGCLLNRRDILPGLVVAWTISMMHRIKIRTPVFRAAVSNYSM